MQNYVHARLGREEVKILKELKAVTKETASAIVKRGLRLVYEQDIHQAKTALERAGDLVGKYCSPFSDLSTNKKHMEGFGK